MAWVQCLVWMSLIVISSSTPDWFKYYSEGSTHFQPSYQASNRQHEYYNYNQDFEWGNHQSSQRQNDSPIQRVNERSISVAQAGSIQRVQENEKRKTEPIKDDRLSRVENGSYKIVNGFVKPYPRIQNRNGGITAESQNNVIFPGSSTTASQYVPQIPEACIKTGICEDVPNYPVALVDRIIKQVGETSDKFNIDESPPPDIAQRAGQPEEVELCDYEKKIVTPHAAPDKDGKWHFIVNRKDKPVQGFHVEICKNTLCNTEVAHFPSHSAKCKQKHMLRHMSALDDNGNMVDRPFAIPSCCTCVLMLNED